MILSFKGLRVTLYGLMVFQLQQLALSLWSYWGDERMIESMWEKQCSVPWLYLNSWFTVNNESFVNQYHLLLVVDSKSKEFYNCANVLLELCLIYYVYFFVELCIFYNVYFFVELCIFYYAYFLLELCIFYNVYF